jgi:hypothetical protein
MSEKSRHTTKLDIQRILKNNCSNQWLDSFEIYGFDVWKFGKGHNEINQNNKKYGIWKDVKGFEGLYEVSNTGDVRTIERTVLRKSKLGKLRNI